jgi:replication factor C subunit 2/4
MINNYSWVEKYRPSKLDEISSQNHIINILKSTLITKNLPHLILFGPSGCGKTSTVLALAKELFGEEHYLDRIIELNASDERGINIIREKIKNYAKLSIKNINNTPPWKIIILDEADTMTSDSQFALRRIIEQYSKITRFCIICNYHTKIIEPIISRCSLLRFKPIEEKFILERLKYICEKENMNYNKKLLNKIIKLCRGDLRKAINLLQKCNNSYNTNTNNINEEILNEISGIIPDNIFEKLMQYIFDKDYKNIDLIINQIYNDGYSLVNQILLFHNYILNSNLSNNNKTDILQKIIEVDHNLINCSDEYIQLYNLVYYIIIKS